MFSLSLWPLIFRSTQTRYPWIRRLNILTIKWSPPVFLASKILKYPIQLHSYPFTAIKGSFFALSCFQSFGELNQVTTAPAHSMLPLLDDFIRSPASDILKLSIQLSLHKSLLRLIAPFLRFLLLHIALSTQPSCPRTRPLIIATMKCSLYLSLTFDLLDYSVQLPL